MRMISIRAMTAAIIVIVVMCAAGLTSGIPVTVQPPDTLVIEPPPPETPTPTPTRPSVVGPIIDEPLVELPEDTPTPVATPTTPVPPATSPPTTTQTTATSTVTPTATPTTLPTPTATQVSPQAPTTMPLGPAAPTVAPLQSPTVQARPIAPAAAVVQASGGLGDKIYPAISGENVVWVNNDSFSVQLYNTSSGNTTTLSNATSVPLAMPYQLAIAGNTAVWSGLNLRTGESNIYLYDTASGRLQQVTEAGPGTYLDPGVSQDYVIWTNRTNESSDVYLYEIGTGNTMPVVTSLSFRMETDVGGTTTVWADNGTAGGDFDIVVAPLGASEGIVLGSPGDDRYPDISSDGQHVAWIGFLENRSAVYLHDVAANNTSPITGASARPDSVAVDGNLVVYSDLRSGNHDIYMYNITTGMESPVTQDPFEQSYPDISNGTIVWMGNNTGQWEIYRVSAGG